LDAPCEGGQDSACDKNLSHWKFGLGAPLLTEDLKFSKFNKERIMSFKNRAKAAAKNIEGKIQEAVGDLTGDSKAQAEGKAKQAEAKVIHSVEDVKDEAKKIID
jgi:uncharacterized protein YjbJ (UPF0337 family)